MMLYDKNQPQPTRKAVALGCASLMLLVGFAYFLPFIAIWVLNVLRRSSGQDVLPYDLQNWTIAFIFISVMIMIVVKGRNRSKRRKG